MINQVSSTDFSKKNPFVDFNVSANIPSYYLTGESYADEFVMQKINKREKRHKLAWGIGLSTVVTGFGTLLLMRGLPKNTGKFLLKVKNFIADGTHLLKGEINSGKLIKKYEQSVASINKAVDKSRSLNNIGWFKDAAFQKLMYKNKYTARLHNYITKQFEKISLKTVNKAYEVSDEAFTGLFRLFDDADVMLSKKLDSSQLIQRIADKRKSITECLSANFDVNSRNNRHSKMREVTETLVDEFWKSFKTKNSYKTSIAEDILAQSKADLAQPLHVARQFIAGNGKNIDGGELKQLLNMYKDVLPETEYINLENAAKLAIKKLDKAIDTDAGEFFDKYRDLKLGCAPTDMLSILTSLGSVGLGLGMADDKDERRSVLLNVGFPIIGSVATALYFTARLVSGFKALVLGALSGIVFSFVGSATDDIITKRQGIEV